jgi:hypothetical protein
MSVHSSFHDFFQSDINLTVIRSAAHLSRISSKTPLNPARTWYAILMSVYAVWSKGRVIIILALVASNCPAFPIEEEGKVLGIFILTEESGGLVDI